MRHLLQTPFENECPDWRFTILGFPYEEKKEFLARRQRSSVRSSARPSICGLVSLIKLLIGFLLM